MPQIQARAPVNPTPSPAPPRRYLIPADYREAFTPQQCAAAEAAMDLLITAAIRAERAERAAAAEQ